MSTAAWTYKLLGAVLIAAVSHCQRFISPPQDVAVEVGSEVILSCQVDLGSDYLEWVEYITDPGGRRIFLSFMNNMQRYIDDTHPWRHKYNIRGSYNLLIKNVTWEDAGRYRCRMLLSDQHGEAELITLGHTKCAPEIDVLEGSKTTLECSVKFNRSKTVTRAPHLQWYNDHYKLSGPLVISSNFVKHSVDFIAHADDNGKKFTCKSYFESSPPEYSSECQTKLNVFFAPRDIDISPMRTHYLPDETVACSASGNPKPSFSWQRISGKGPVNIYGNILILSKNMEGNNTYRCLASNVIYGGQHVNYRDFSFNVFIPTISISYKKNSGAKRTSLKTSSTSRTAVTSLAAILISLAFTTTPFFQWRYT